MSEIAPGLRVVLAPNPGPMTLDGTNTWILGGTRRGGSGGPSIVVDPGPLDEGHLRRVHEDFPQHPLIAWCDLNRMKSHEVLEVAKSGAQDIVRRDLDELRHAFTRILASAAQRAVSVQIASELQDLVPRSLMPVLEFALERANQHLARNAVAAVFGVSRRTLHGRLIENRLPPTREFLTWCRLMVASALLDQPGHTLDSVAGQLDYGDGGVLGKSLRRYTGSGINKLRDGGVLDATMAAFRATVACGGSADYEPEADSLPVPSSAN